MTDYDGIILKGVGGLYSVRHSATGKIYTCTARGIFRKEAVKPLTGDYVSLCEIDDENMTAAIAGLAPRKSELRRPAVANIDKIIFAAASESPKPDLMLLDKMIISAQIKGIEFILMISKSDQDKRAAEELYAEYSPAVKCFITSAKNAEGFEELAGYIDGCITVLAGQSGAGKSTFINYIAGHTLMDTGELSGRTKRGRHTTRHSELFTVTKGFSSPTFIIDSPGFSMLDADEMEPIRLQDYYPEMYNNKSACRFINCSHTGEPGCFTRELVESGRMHPERLARYVKIYKELDEKYKNRYR